MTADRGNYRLWILLAIVALVASGAWLLLSDDDDSSADATVPATIVDGDGLRERVAEEETPIYWAGEQPGTQLELNVPEEGRTYVRYLTGDAEAGDPRPDFLTVGTYAFAEPIPALEELAEKPGGVERSAPGGGFVYFNRDVPSSVYLAYPGVEAQIEIFDPNPVRAKELATSGSIVPVE